MKPCESCGLVRYGTHLLDFHDGGRAFFVCEDCAFELVERGLASAMWIGLQELDAQ